jgi:hypothetical protein
MPNRKDLPPPTDEDISYIARQMIALHGFEAEPEAAAMERKMVLRGDLEGLAVWQRIGDAIRSVPKRRGRSR